MTELEKVSDPLSRAIIEERVIEAICFEEFAAWMGPDVPAWFDLAKCWEEETGEPAGRVKA
ncbi:MAG: hypothetical protein R3E95_23940 [Thiolinea sp.]